MKYLLTIIICFISFQVCADERAIRDSKDLFLSSTLGLHVPTLLTPSVKVGTISKDWIIGIEYGETKFSDIQDNEVTIKDGSITNKGISTRYFFSSNFDTLNLYTTLNQRQFNTLVRVDIRDTINSPFKNASYSESDLSITATVLSIALGNCWVFNNGFFINVDWYMYSALLDKKYSYKLTSDGAISDSDKSKVIKDIDDFSKTISNIAEYDGILLITFGFSF